MPAEPEIALRRGLSLPRRAVRRLAQVGIFAKPNVSLEHQSMAQRPSFDADVAPTFRSARFDQHVARPPQWGALRKSTIANQQQAGIFHPLHEPRIFVPRVLTPEFCPADFVARMGLASRRWETCART